MLCLLSGPPGFNCLIYFAPVISNCTVESLLHLLFLIYMYVYLEMIHGKVRDLWCKPNIYVSRSTSELRVRLIP